MALVPDVLVMEEMLTRAKVDFEKEKGEDGVTLLIVEGGYAGFVTYLTFDAKGDLLNVEAFE